MNEKVQFSLEEIKRAYPKLNEKAAKSLQRWLNQHLVFMEGQRAIRHYVTNPEYWRTVAKIRGKQK